MKELIALAFAALLLFGCLGTTDTRAGLVDQVIPEVQNWKVYVIPVCEDELVCYSEIHTMSTGAIWCTDKLSLVSKYCPRTVI